MLRIFDAHDRLFISRWLRSPLNIGAVLPSAAALARLMAAQVDPAKHGTVVELGGGTGTITAALLDVGVAPERLIVIERDERLHSLLTARFPHVAVLQGDAVGLLSGLRQGRATPISIVISGLPLLSMAEKRQRAILDEAFSCMGDHGVFVQFTYGSGSPVSRASLARWGFEARPVGTAWLNVPPATVWRITKAPVIAP